MSLKPAISIQSQSQDATLAFLVDSTGNYSAANPGGYGAPNELKGNIISCTLTVTLPNVPFLYPAPPSSYDSVSNSQYNVSSSYAPTTPPIVPTPVTIVLNGSTTPSAVSFANGTVPLILNSGIMGIGNNVILPNGVYSFIYTILFTDGTSFIGNGNFFLIGGAKVCQFAKIGAIALLQPDSPAYDNENALSITYIGLIIQAAINANLCGDLSGAQKMCEWLDVRCNTLLPGTQVTNYGQASNGLDMDGCGCGTGQVFASGGTPGSVVSTIPPVIQFSVSTVWTVSHGLGRNPGVVTTTNQAGIVAGQVNYVDLNNLTITFLVPYSGSTQLT